ncbi:metallophosphoesterase [Corynebacterium auriscanis]|uniref:Phosphoprotein phosphatase n=1 Tax=Corynebacterium auriscanis TaxID=99807 RepID=A0A0A2DIT7_9CORY|nr:metallophosphoesterase [Corynebacterium auriscanis]KGM19083.1 phosphoprotein phosphatase [Corynebacterium auriscanis]WJY72342.1 hypothetical protein CAURIC_03430 [Corynebacterium auriscanis]
MSTTWFTSDLHLGHPFVANLRGYDNVGEHDQRILDNLRATLGAGDTLWVLGDCSSGWGPQEERALRLLEDTFHYIRTHLGVDFTAHLISGNHDSCHPMYTDSAAAQRDFLRVFDSVQPFQYYEFGGEPAWLCHFPRPGFDHEGMDSRHDELRLRVDRLIHGHLHSPVPITGRGQVDVGLDAWGMKPVSEDRVHTALLRSFEEFPMD